MSDILREFRLKTPKVTTGDIATNQYNGISNSDLNKVVVPQQAEQQPAQQPAIQQVSHQVQQPNQQANNNKPAPARTSYDARRLASAAEARRKEAKEASPYAQMLRNRRARYDAEMMRRREIARQKYPWHYNRRYGSQPQSNQIAQND
tara:strand:+ start:41 stop:484 length:444 start_codon:yes stop_codon:yes gene_type:complete